MIAKARDESLPSAPLSPCRGHYKSMQSVRVDFELMCLNALVFNKATDEYWVEAKNFEIRGQAIFQLLDRRTQVT